MLHGSCEVTRHAVSWAFGDTVHDAWMTSNEESLVIRLVRSNFPVKFPNHVTTVQFEAQMFPRSC